MTARPHAILDAVPDPVLVVGTDGRLCFANRAAFERFGWTASELPGDDVTALVHPDDLVTAMSSLASVQRKDVGTLVTIRVRDHTGSYGSYEVRGRSAVDDPDVDGVVLVMRDVTDRGKWELDGGADAVTRSVLQYAPGITMVLTPDGRLRGASRAYTSVLGRDLESTLGMPLWQLTTEADEARVRAELTIVAERGGSRSFEARMNRGDGREPVPLQLDVVNLLDDPSIEGFVVTALEITALVEARKRMNHHASYDHLTGLVNRRCLREWLGRALEGARRTGTTVAVLYCDVDGFKRINDRFGHRAGDEVLVEVSRRFRASVRDMDVVGRYGGDEFVIVVVDASDATHAAVRRRVEAALDEPISLSNGSVAEIRVSVGSASDDGSSDVDDVIARADSAMYRAKQPGR
jgi:diguanylate cyclase (GGDEF)-like protein/PAS domain S-box-containing protein